MTTPVSTTLSRRTFLVSTAAAGGTLSLGFHIPFATPAQAAADLAPYSTNGAEVTAWLLIQPDDTVIIRVARSEMGQGAMTALPMLVAEELECDWSKVKAEYAPPSENLKRGRAWGDMSTGGSRGVRGSQDYLRKAGATARLMLIAAAADEWKVPASECRAANSTITHVPSGRTTTFGKVAAAAAKVAPPADAPLKDPKDWKLAGKPMKRLDTPEKLDGSLKYAIDVRVPDMLHAAVAICPVFGGKLKSFDTAKISGMPGVRHVLAAGDDMVAVVADSYWQAKTALDALPVTWDEGPNAKVSDATIRAHIGAGLAATDAAPITKSGDAPAAISAAARKITADYGTPFLNHATMEPMTCTARVDGDKVEVWVSSQNGEAALASAAAAAGVKPENVYVHKMHLGGGFGRRGAFHDHVQYGVLIAKQVPGRAVKMIWSREEDMQHGFYRPISQARMSAALDDKGIPTALHIRISAQSIIAQHFPTRLAGGVDRLAMQGLVQDEIGYALPDLLVDYAMRNTHVPVGFWRSVNHTQNCFYKESFIDEIAHAGKQDPFELRRRMLAKAPKHLRVLEIVAEKADWGKPLPAGVFRGIAVENSFGSYQALVAEVSVSDRGRLKVHRIVNAIDCGYAVNPDTIDAQMQGSVVYAMTAMLYGENTIKDGRVVEGNFDTYEMMRIDEMPKVENHVVPSGGFWGGIGEAGVPPVAPAICNAIFAATGTRVRSLPLKNLKLRA